MVAYGAVNKAAFVNGGIMTTRHRRLGIPRGLACFYARLILTACILCAVFVLFSRLEISIGLWEQKHAAVIERPSKKIVLVPTRHNGPTQRLPGNLVNHTETWKFTYSLKILPTACQTSIRHCNYTERVIICVSTGSNQLEKRQGVRNTWGSWPGVRVLFFFGANKSFQRQLVDEAAKYDDIVQYDFLDTYQNLTYKSISMLRFVSALKWPELKFFIKSDDDTFVNMRLLPKVLSAIQKPGIFGAIQKNARPNRTKKAKWYVPEKEFPHKVFPPYVSGCFYIIPITQAIQMSEHATDLHLFRFEDTYITGLLAEKLNISRYFVPKAGVDFAGSNITDSKIVYSLIAKHYVKPEKMVKIFSYIKNSKSKQIS
ncbi:beta-1 [Tropilaelaps mercedesae]|uniref:Hexosyltransferase n=1 Tax=Tropilaelaps mercedesae TaxID=418985 RepID=A0A1V9XRG4_9ACAR|nr:beta-1 [Tropilaelaps mercedesae]